VRALRLARIADKAERSPREGRRVNTYNTLLSADDADAAVRRNPGFDEFLASFARLAVRHEVPEVAGACLLHRHFTLRDEQVIIEKADTWRGEAALISTPNAFDCARAAPSMWRFGADGHGPEALEFSEDPAVHDDVASIPDDFYADFAELLDRSDLLELIGLTVLRRETLPLRHGERYLEETDAGRSVVVVCADATKSDDAIATVWAPGEYMGCSVYNTCHQRNICRFADNEHRHILGHTTERSHHRS